MRSVRTDSGENTVPALTNVSPTEELTRAEGPAFACRKYCPRLNGFCFLFGVALLAKRPQIGHDCLGVRASHVKVRHGVLKRISVDPYGGGQQRNHAFIGGRRSAGQSRSVDGPRRAGLRWKKRVGSAGQPPAAIQLPVRQSRRVTVTTHRDVFHDVLATGYIPGGCRRRCPTLGRLRLRRTRATGQQGEGGNGRAQGKVSKKVVMIRGCKGHRPSLRVL
jgi:hypothetical protein